jgi:hypothetical protein
MVGESHSPAQSDSLWSRTVSLIRALDEALHMSEIDLLEARIQRLEQQLERMAAANATIKTDGEPQ